MLRERPCAGVEVHIAGRGVETGGPVARAHFYEGRVRDEQGQHGAVHEGAAVGEEVERNGKRRCTIGQRSAQDLQGVRALRGARAEDYARWCNAASGVEACGLQEVAVLLEVLVLRAEPAENNDEATRRGLPPCLAGPPASGPHYTVSQARRRESPSHRGLDLRTEPLQPFRVLSQEQEEEENRHRGIVELSEGG